MLARVGRLPLRKKKGKIEIQAALIYTNKAKRNLFVCLLVCLSGMSSHALYGMAPCFGHTG